MKKLFSYPRQARDWLLTDNRRDADMLTRDLHRPLLFFAFSVVAYCLYLVAMRPDWVLGGEMWAESATNYFPNASSPSLAVKFFSKDVGYIPLPQRLLALVGHALNLPARSIPYFYTWSALVLTACMVGSFCLKHFRVLIHNDWLRLCTVIAVLLVADFETRTFINFTYFVAFFVGIVAALAFVEKSRDVPWWSWIIPVLMVSKPATLAALPIVLLAALVSKPRFRLIAIVTALCCFAQLTTMFFDPVKTFVGATTFSFPEKLRASIHYFFSLLGVLVTGDTDPTSHRQPEIIGLAILLVSLGVALKARTNASAIIFLGLSLHLFNTAVHCFALPAAFNTNMERLLNFRVERYVSVGYFGAVLLVAGLLAALTEPRMGRNAIWRARLAAPLFAAWFIFAGWFNEAGAINRVPAKPLITSSQWQFMADLIDSGEPVCVPVDPVDMMYLRDCRQLNAQVGGFQWPTIFTFESLRVSNGGSAFELEPPPSTRGNNLLSLAVMLKPQMPTTIAVDARAALRMRDGTVKYLVGNRRLPPSGGLVMLIGKGRTAIDDIVSVQLEFSAPLELGYSVPWNGYEHSPVVFWMGN